MLAQILYTHSRYLWLTVLVIALVGASSLRSLGRQEDPTITNLFATVLTMVVVPLFYVIFYRVSSPEKA